MRELAQRMRALRLERQMKQEEMARQLGLSMSAYCRYERGEREPTASTIVALADFFAVSADYLLGRTDQR